MGSGIARSCVCDGRVEGGLAGYDEVVVVEVVGVGAGEEVFEEWCTDAVFEAGVLVLEGGAVDDIDGVGTVHDGDRSVAWVGGRLTEVLRCTSFFCRCWRLAVLVMVERFVTTRL